MLIGDPIGCFTHIECRESLFITPKSGHFPVWVLALESDEAEAEIAAMIIANTPTLELLDQAFRDGLLHELHAGWLDSNDPWGLLRFRYGYNPDWALRIRLPEVNTFQLTEIPRAREDIIHKWKQSFQSLGPFDLIILLVSKKPISRGSRAVPWD